METPSAAAPLTPEERERLDELEGYIDCGFWNIGLCLREIRDARLYRGEYRTFEAYVGVRWGMTRRWAYGLIESAEAALPLTQLDGVPGPTRAAHVEPLKRLPPEDAVRAWRLAHQLKGEGRLTQAVVERAAREVAPGLFPAMPNSEAPSGPLDEPDPSVGEPGGSEIADFGGVAAEPGEDPPSGDGAAGGGASPAGGTTWGADAGSPSGDGSPTRPPPTVTPAPAWEGMPAASGDVSGSQGRREPPASQAAPPAETAGIPPEVVAAALAVLRLDSKPEVSMCQRGFLLEDAEGTREVVRLLRVVGCPFIALPRP